MSEGILQIWIRLQPCQANKEDNLALSQFLWKAYKLIWESTIQTQTIYQSPATQVDNIRPLYWNMFYRHDNDFQDYALYRPQQL